MLSSTKPSLFPLTRNCFTQQVNPDLELSMKIALDKESVRYSIKEYVLQYVANRIERLAPSVVWPIARDRTTYDTLYLQDWVEIRGNVEHRELSSARQITNTIEMMSVVFMEIHDAGLIPVDNSHLAEAMRLQMCCLYNPRTLVHFAESHAFFNVWNDTTPLPGFAPKPMGSSSQYIFRLENEKDEVEADVFDVEPKPDTPHLAWLKNPDTLASMMHTAGAAKRFQTTVAQVLAKPADDAWKAPLEVLLAAVSKYVPVEKVLTWEQAMDAFETDSSEDGDADAVGPQLLDITECMRGYLV